MQGKQFIKPLPGYIFCSGKLSEDETNHVLNSSTKLQILRLIMETFAELIKSEKPVLVDFYADWCGPCKAMESVIKDVAKLVKDQFRVVKVDIDKQTQTASDYQISGVPTFMIFRKGKVIWRHSGMIEKSRLLSILGDKIKDSASDKV